LVEKRNCALVRTEAAVNARPVWARGHVISKHCPKSVITGQSLHWLEIFRFWKSMGAGPVWDMPAKCADALLLLEKEWQKEMENGKVQK